MKAIELFGSGVEVLSVSKEICNCPEHKGSCVEELHGITPRRKMFVLQLFDGLYEVWIGPFEKDWQHFPSAKRVTVEVAARMILDN